MHESLDEDSQKTRALQCLSIKFKKQLRSPAIGFEGMLVAASDKFDMVKTLRRNAAKAFKEDPQKAIADGLTNEEGIPLDPRPKWSTGRDNPGFARPLPEHNWRRTIYGVAVKSSEKEGKPKFFSMNLSGSIAEKENLPLFKEVAFRAIDKSEDGDVTITMNASMYTTFEEAELNMPAPLDVIKTFCDDLTVNLKDLDSYHAQNKADFNRLAIIKGDVSTLVMEPTSVGSRRMVIESESALEDLDAAGTTCWVPAHIDIDFAENSKVIVIGSSAQGFKYENGAKTEELGDVTFNAMGIYAIPEFKISPEVEEITEENIVEMASEPPKNPAEKTSW